MDVTNLDIWKQEWAAFSSAPYIILPFIVLGWVAAWWFRGRTTEGNIASLREQIATWDLRLKHATDLVAASDQAKEELDKQFQAYKAEVAIKGSNASPVKVDAALVQLNKDDALITHALKVARQAAVETSARCSLPVGAGYPVDSSKYQALRDLDGLGAFRKLDAAKLEALRDLDGLGVLRKLDSETLDKIKDIGKPFLGRNMGTTLNSIPAHIRNGK
jgi:hypothetical protein